jgi:hypothetical protein
MKDNRIGGIALIVGTIGGVITLLIHPSGRDLFAPDQFAHTAQLLAVAHALAIVSVAAWFLGALAIARHLASPDRLAIAALVVFGFACAAVISSATVDGFVAPAVLRKVIFEPPQVSEQWRLLLAYNDLLNQAFAEIFVVAWAIAIVLWSVSIVKSRLLTPAAGIYGLFVGAASVIAVVAGVSGHADVIHLVMLGQIIWFPIVGILMWRKEN